MSVNAIRVLAADAVQKAKSGHPGLPLGAAAMSFELWAKHMNHNPKNQDGRTGIVSFFPGGHGSTLLYSLLHLFRLRPYKRGYDEFPSDGFPDTGTSGVWPYSRR
ncbi:MAG: hypothetical protein ACLR0U_05315 [Enterocloster clostridioformis]